MPKINALSAMMEPTALPKASPGSPLHAASTETAAIRQTMTDQEALKQSAAQDFPLSEAEIADLRAEIRRHVLLVHNAEQEAVLALKAASAAR